MLAAGSESGDGTPEITYFAHAAVEPSISTRGTAVHHDKLGLNGGPSRSTATRPTRTCGAGG